MNIQDVENIMEGAEALGAFRSQLVSQGFSDQAAEEIVLATIMQPPAQCACPLCQKTGR